MWFGAGQRLVLVNVFCKRVRVPLMSDCVYMFCRHAKQGSLLGFTFLHTLTLGNNRIGNLQVNKDLILSGIFRDQMPRVPFRDAWPCVSSISRTQQQTHKRCKLSNVSLLSMLISLLRNPHTKRGKYA